MKLLMKMSSHTKYNVPLKFDDNFRTFKEQLSHMTTTTLVRAIPVTLNAQNGSKHKDTTDDLVGFRKVVQHNDKSINLEGTGVCSDSLHRYIIARE